MYETFTHADKIKRVPSSLLIFPSSSSIHQHFFASRSLTSALTPFIFPSFHFFPGGHTASSPLSFPYPSPWGKDVLNNSEQGLIYKSACSAQTSQSRSSVWQLIMAGERHGGLISNDTLLFPNWCTTSAQCVPNERV